MECANKRSISGRRSGSTWYLIHIIMLYVIRLYEPNINLSSLALKCGQYTLKKWTLLCIQKHDRIPNAQWAFVSVWSIFLVLTECANQMQKLTERSESSRASGYTHVLSQVSLWLRPFIQSPSDHPSGNLNTALNGSCTQNACRATKIGAVANQRLICSEVINM